LLNKGVLTVKQHQRAIAGLATLAVAIAFGALLVVPKSTTTEILYQTDGPLFDDVESLTSASQTVAHVRVVGIGKSYVVPFDAAQVHVAAPSTDGPKGQATRQDPPPAAPPQIKGLYKTDVTVEVIENVRGGNARKGDRLTITHLGGTDERGRVYAAEHDPMPTLGDQEIMFLRQSSSGGKFFTTGGGQGRFKVGSTGQLTPVERESRLAKLQAGKPAEALKSAVRGVRATRSVAD
jgi:hypothetical protein